METINRDLLNQNLPQNTIDKMEDGPISYYRRSHIWPSHGKFDRFLCGCSFRDLRGFYFVGWEVY